MISYVELWWHFLRHSRTIVQNREHYEEHFCGIILNLDQECRRNSRALAALLFDTVEPLCKVGRRHYENHFCENIV